jgi:aminoglycoside 3-N-acetyltransferase
LSGTFDGRINIPEGTPAESARARQDLIALMVWNGLLPDPSDEGGSHKALRRGARYAPGGSSGALSFKELTAALLKAGLGAGDTALLHSDLSTMGLVEGARDREGVLEFYFNAFLEVLGPSGTLTMCTSFEDYGRYGSPFDLEQSPSRLGALSEYLRTRPNAVRSLHPIVSLTAFGARAEEICGGCHNDGFGYDSPWGRLHRADAKLLTLGMGRYPEMGLTFLHYIEHAFGVPYQYTKIFNAPVTRGGKLVSGPFTMSVRYLDFGITYDTNRFKNELLSAGRAKLIPVGADAVFCTTASHAMEFAVERLRENRYYFLKEAPRFRAGEIPMDGATGELQYVYDKAVPQAKK